MKLGERVFGWVLAVAACGGAACGGVHTEAATSTRRAVSATEEPAMAVFDQEFTNAPRWHRRPEPRGSLNEALQTLYPPEARAVGMEGEVRMRIRIGRDGSAEPLRSEGPQNVIFDPACAQLIRESRWVPALDAEEQPMTVEVDFTCSFRIGPGASAQPTPSELLDDLFQRPRPPPNLDRQLERFYPEAARDRHLGGSARVLIRIREDGSVEPLQILEGVFVEFVYACVDMLLQVQFRPAIDQDGHTVSVTVPFQCDFRAVGGLNADELVEEKPLGHSLEDGSPPDPAGGPPIGELAENRVPTSRSGGGAP